MSLSPSKNRLIEDEAAENRKKIREQEISTFNQKLCYNLNLQQKESQKELTRYLEEQEQHYRHVINEQIKWEHNRKY